MVRAAKQGEQEMAVAPGDSVAHGDAGDAAVPLKWTGYVINRQGITASGLFYGTGPLPPPDAEYVIVDKRGKRRLA